VRSRPILWIVLALTVVGALVWYEYQEYERLGYNSPVWKQFYEGNYVTSCGIENVTIIGDKVVLLSKTLSQWDAQKSELQPFKLGGSKEIYAACQDNSGNAVLLCKFEDRVVVRRQHGNIWQTLAVPPSVAKEPDMFKLATDGKFLAMASPVHEFVLAENNWSELKRPESEKTEGSLRLPDGRVTGLALGRGIIYKSIDRGEWGGEVNSLDLTTGQRLVLYSGSVPFLAQSRTGELWFIERNVFGSGLFSFNGELQLESTIQGFRWDFLKKFDNLFSAPLLEEIHARKNWKLAPTEFLGLKCLDDGSVMVATRNYGLMKYKAGAWEIVSAYWPEDSWIWLSGLEITPDQIAVIPVYKRGLIFYDLKNKSYKFWIDPAFKPVPNQ
jgi:hypothetical protein